MAFEELKERFGAKGTIIGAVLVAIVAGLFVINNFALKGKVIAYRSVSPPGELKFTVSSPGTRHVVELYTSRKQRVSYTLAGPHGTQLFSTRDYTDKKTRRKKFKPTQAGEHTLKVERGILTGRTRSVSVRVYERDRRIILF